MKCTAAVIVALLLAAPAWAQTRPAPARPAPVRPPSERIFVSVDGMYQTGGSDFGETVTFTRNVENGTFSTDYSVSSGPAFNVAVTGVVWRNIGVGVAVSRFSHSTPTTLTAAVPHPFFFNTPRSVTGEIGGLTREELAVHVQLRALFNASRRVQGSVFGGPSFFSVKQDIVNNFEITEAYPYDIATFSRGVTDSVSESKVGFNVGADVGYYFTQQVGVGGTVQYSGATVEVPGSGGTGTFDVKAGGLQAGGGLRLRF